MKPQREHLNGGPVGYVLTVALLLWGIANGAKGVEKQMPICNGMGMILCYWGRAEGATIVAALIAIGIVALVARKVFKRK